MMVPPDQQYNVSQYNPISDPAMIPQSQAGWGTAPPAVAQSMPLQMHNNIYMPPGNVPPQMPSGNMPPGNMPPGNVPPQMPPGNMPPGMQFSNPGMLQPASTLPAYGSDRIQ
jgi:polypyrimidine tract-binding protein 2